VSGVQAAAPPSGERARRYRVGSTSFVYPARWYENARRLAGRVEDVEILLFDPPTPVSLPSQAEVALLARLGAESGLGYTVHAPLGFALASEDPARRRAAVEAMAQVVRATAPLAPHAVIVHLAPGEREGDPPPVDADAFRRRAAESLSAVLATGLPPDRLCLETLEYDFALAEPVVEALGLSVALDVGHLARDGVGFDAVLARNLARTRVVHWHGTDPSGRDHRSLSHYPRAEGVRLLRALREGGFSGVLTLEVFGEQDLDESLGILAELEGEVVA
jgi:sugar phosphate isomerase/epimerase